MSGDLLTSVWGGGGDGPLLDRLIAMHGPQESGPLVDVTYNKGRIWRDSENCGRVIRLDISREHQVHAVADFRRLPLADECISIIVFDPPHVPNRSLGESVKDFNDRFGIDVRSGASEGYSLRHLNAAFLVEASRVLAQEGIILAKLIDYVHNHRYVWALNEFVQDAQANGLTACDLVIKVRKGPIRDPRWASQKHSRRSHSYWCVLRKGRCERKRRKKSNKKTEGSRATR